MSAALDPIAAAYRPWLWEIWPVGWPLAIPFGADIGTLMEWQLDD